MNNKERVLASLKHQQPDKIPYQIGFTKRAEEKMAAFFGDPDFKTKLGNSLFALDSRIKGSMREVEHSIWEDEFGVRWNRSTDLNIGVVCNCRVTPENIDKYELPDPDAPERYQGFGEVLAAHCDDFLVFNHSYSLHERAWMLAGFENFLMAMIANPSFAHDLLDKILDYNLKLIEHACQYNFDGIKFGDDWGQQTSLIMGPNLWREFIKPRIEKMYQLVKSRGKYVMIHSCGKVDELLPELIELGVDVFNPFQPEVMDVFEIKKEYGDRLSFWGGISTQRTLPYATVREVKDEVRRLLDEVGKNGGYIAAPAHSIPGDAKPENIAAMIEVLDNQ